MIAHYKRNLKRTIELPWRKRQEQRSKALARQSSRKAVLVSLSIVAGLMVIVAASLIAIQHAAERERTRALSATVEKLLERFSASQPVGHEVSNEVLNTLQGILREVKSGDSDRPVPGRSMGISAALAIAAATLLALSMFFGPKLLQAKSLKAKLEIVAQIMSIVSVVVAVVFGVIATLQAWKQIAIAAADGGGVDVGVYPPDLLETRLKEVARIGTFVSTRSDATEKNDLSNQLCRVRSQLHGENPTYLLVVGRHDVRGYRGVKAGRSDVNSSLAQRRADFVSRHLRESTECAVGPIRFTVVTLVGGPRILEARGESESASDREVVIYAVSAQRRETESAPIR